MNKCDYRCSATKALIEWTVAGHSLYTCGHHGRQMYGTLDENNDLIAVWIETGEPFDKDSFWEPTVEVVEETEETDEDDESEEEEDEDGE